MTQKRLNLLCCLDKTSMTVLIDSNWNKFKYDQCTILWNKKHLLCASSCFYIVNKMLLSSRIYNLPIVFFEQIDSVLNRYNFNRSQIKHPKRRLKHQKKGHQEHEFKNNYHVFFNKQVKINPQNDSILITCVFE